MQRIIRTAVVVAVLAASLPVAAAQEPPSRPDHQARPATGPVLVSVGGREGDPLAVAGEFLIKLDGARLLGRGTERLGFGWSLIRDSSPLPPAVRAAQLSSELGVTVVPNGVSQLLGPNPEPDAALQWPLENTSGTPDADIDATDAWDITTGSGVVVAVLDSGIDQTHPDLAGTVWVNPDEIPGNGLDDDSNGFEDDVNGWDFFSNDNDPMDEGGGGHGTFVSGIIGAPINGVGIAGVAPDATIMPVRVCGSNGCFDSDVIAGLAYAAANGAHVANLSLGRETGDQLIDDIFESGFSDAIGAGLSVVAAAGNFGGNNDDPQSSVFGTPSIPASFPLSGLLSVAMTDEFDALDTFSNFGATTVDLAAPGVSIYSSLPPASSPSGYGFGDGTSFAAPHVAGVAALVLSEDPCLTPNQVEARIRRGADRLPNLTGLVATGARLNAYRALTEFAPSASASYGGAPFTVDFGVDVCSGSYLWTFGDGGSANGFSVTHTYSGPGIYEATVTVGGTLHTFEIIAGAPFTDIGGNPFEKEIYWLSATGVTLGCNQSSTLYCPNDSVTRGQMASFLSRALNLPAASQDHFTDDATSTHQENINRLREAGITLGCDADGTLFCPEDEITREQMATFLTRGYGLAATTQDFFTDDGGVHESNINALAASGITLGCDSSLFCPKDPVPRRQMAAFLYRADGTDLG